MMLIDSIIPYYDDTDTQNNGTTIHVSSLCKRCTYQVCRSKTDGNFKTCGHGFNYATIDGVRCFGFLIHPPLVNNHPVSKVNRAYMENRIPQYMIRNFRNEIINKHKQIINKVDEEAKKIVEIYRTSDKYRKDLFANLRDEINKQLSFVHDYKQINSLISQNMNILLIEKYQNTNVEEIIDEAQDCEKAIYYAAKLLEEKINATLFLIIPEQLQNTGNITRFKFFGLVLKLKRVYYPLFQKKNITVNIVGGSEMEIYGIANAISIIPQTFIDNAQKYAPEGSIITIRFREKVDGIMFSVESLGPEIYDSEKKKIFDFMTRGEKAKKVAGGMGYGLFLSQYIAKEHLGSEIECMQDKKNKQKGDTYLTKFSVFIPEKCLSL